MISYKKFIAFACCLCSNKIILLLVCINNKDWRPTRNTRLLLQECLLGQKNMVLRGRFFYWMSSHLWKHRTGYRWNADKEWDSHSKQKPKSSEYMLNTDDGIPQEEVHQSLKRVSWGRWLCLTSVSSWTRLMSPNSHPPPFSVTELDVLFIVVSIKIVLIKDNGTTNIVTKSFSFYWACS